MFNQSNLNTQIANDKNKVLDLQALREVSGGLQDAWSTPSLCCTNGDEWSTASGGCY